MKRPCFWCSKECDAYYCSPEHRKLGGDYPALIGSTTWQDSSISSNSTNKEAQEHGVAHESSMDGSAMA